ncbi:MAG TPA: hypothetical protein VEZ11_01555 [Thermoanaerobaculia bacterium]|nr:hypothetical protein [Thermoanaerobaculia bacterium]
MCRFAFCGTIFAIAAFVISAIQIVPFFAIAIPAGCSSLFVGSSISIA